MFEAHGIAQVKQYWAKLSGGKPGAAILAYFNDHT